jgi:hypothetical protein
MNPYRRAPRWYARSAVLDRSTSLNAELRCPCCAGAALRAIETVTNDAVALVFRLTCRCTARIEARIERRSNGRAFVFARLEAA